MSDMRYTIYDRQEGKTIFASMFLDAAVGVLKSLTGGKAPKVIRYTMQTKHKTQVYVQQSTNVDQPTKKENVS